MRQREGFVLRAAGYWEGVDQSARWALGPHRGEPPDEGVSFHWVVLCIGFLGLLHQVTANLGGLKQQRLILFWRLKVGIPGVARVFALQAQGGGMSLSFPGLWCLPAFFGLWLHASNLCFHRRPCVFCPLLSL